MEKKERVILHNAPGYDPGFTQGFTHPLLRLDTIVDASIRLFLTWCKRPVTGRS